MTSFVDGKAVLSIKRIYFEDEGVYTCVAVNSIGRSFASACIIVDGRLHCERGGFRTKCYTIVFLIISVPEEKENLICRQLIKPCALVSANSTPYSTPRATPARSVSPGMHAQRPANTMDYNKKKSKVQKCSAPKFYTVPHNRIAEEGDTVTFQCAIRGHPLPWTTWDKDGRITTPSTRITIKERNELRILEISEVTLEDAGLYRITLENEYGRIEASARLDILRNNKSTSRARVSASPRRAISSSRRIMGNSTRIGGRLVLACDFRGNSMPVTKFYQNGTEVIPSDRIRISNDSTRSTLAIDRVSASDEGVYTCIAENEFGIAATSTKFSLENEYADDVNQLPEILLPLNPITSWHEGSTLDLKCIVRSVTPFDFIWKKENVVICDSEDFR